MCNKKPMKNFRRTERPKYRVGVESFVRRKISLPKFSSAEILSDMVPCRAGEMRCHKSKYFMSNNVQQKLEGDYMY